MGANMIGHIIDKILDNFQGLDDTLESGIDIIEANELEIDRLKDIARESNISLSEEVYKERLEEILKKQNDLIEDIKIKQNNILKGLNQFGKKNQAINSYIKVDRQPIFIDKNS